MFPTIPNRRPTIGPRYRMKQQCTLDISIEYMEIFHNCPRPWAPLVFFAISLWLGVVSWSSWEPTNGNEFESQGKLGLIGAFMLGSKNQGTSNSSNPIG